MYVALTYIPGGGLLTGFAMRSDPNFLWRPKCDCSKLKTHIHSSRDYFFSSRSRRRKLKSKTPLWPGLRRAFTCLHAQHATCAHVPGNFSKLCGRPFYLAAELSCEPPAPPRVPSARSRPAGTASPRPPCCGCARARPQAPRLPEVAAAMGHGSGRRTDAARMAMRPASMASTLATRASSASGLSHRNWTAHR